MNERPRVPWRDVWRMYLENEGVFSRVVANLRAAAFPLSQEEGLDFVHEFLLTRAPYALATFEPSRGNLPGWLFVVFRRFVLGEYRRRQRAREIVAAFERQLGDDPGEPQRESSEAIDAAETAVTSLPSEQREALRVFFGEREHGIRAVARALRMSRWKAERTVVQAAARIVLELELDVGLSASDLHVVARGSDSGANLTGAVRVAHHQSSGIRHTDKSREHLARLLGVRNPRLKERSVMRNLPAERENATCEDGKKLQQFLQGQPRELDWREATVLLAHAASCEHCARGLSEQPAHAEALLESTHPPAEPSPKVEDAIAMAQREIAIIGTAVLRAVAPSVPKQMGGAVSPERRRQLWTLGELPDSEFRAALAVSEMALALQSILASDWNGKAEVVVTAHEVNVSTGSSVPATYMVARIAEHADVDADTALALWRGLVTVVRDGGTGLPGLHITQLTKDGAGMVLALEKP